MLLQDRDRHNFWGVYKRAAPCKRSRTGALRVKPRCRGQGLHKNYGLYPSVDNDSVIHTDSAHKWFNSGF